MIIPEVEPNISFFPFLERDGGFEAWNTLDLVFTHFKLNEIRQALWDWYKAALLDQSTNSSARDRSDLAFFFECMNDMATAAYVVAKEKYLQERAAETPPQGGDVAAKSEPSVEN